MNVAEAAIGMRMESRGLKINGHGCDDYIDEFKPDLQHNDQHVIGTLEINNDTFYEIWVDHADSDIVYVIGDVVSAKNESIVALPSAGELAEFRKLLEEDLQTLDLLKYTLGFGVFIRVTSA